MNLSISVRRVAALSLFLAVLWTIWAVIVSPTLDSLSTDRRSIRHSLQMLDHYRQLAKFAPDFESQRSVLLSRFDDKGFLLGSDPSLVAAEMQVMAGRLAVSSGAIVQSSRTLSGSEDEGFWKGEVLMELQASAGQLKQLLYEIQANQPIIFVEKINIRAAEDGTAPNSNDKQPLANVRLQLASYAVLKKRSK